MDIEGKQPPEFGRSPGYRTYFLPATRGDLNEFLHQLLSTEWDTPDSPLRLRGDLELGEVAGTQFYNQTRIFLRLLAEESKGTPLTAIGNLKLATVARMCERMEWPRQRVEFFRNVGARRMTEEDVFPLHLIRVVCDCGRLIRRRHNRLFVVKRALRLLADDRAGQFYRHLFLVFFREFNLDYMPAGREVPLVQESMAVVLWRLSVVANEWIPADRLPDELFLESVRRQVVRPSSFPEEADWVIASHILRPLQWFGLLEGDPPLDDRRLLRDPVRYRKTPLFDRFISFEPRPFRLTPGPAPNPDWA